MSVEPLEPRALAERLAAGEPLVLLDVREPDEVAIASIGAAVAIPLGELSVRHVELDPDAPTVVVCHHGIRSANAALALEHLGFEELYNLSGGIDRWAREVDPQMARY